MRGRPRAIVQGLELCYNFEECKDHNDFLLLEGFE